MTSTVGCFKLATGNVGSRNDHANRHRAAPKLVGLKCTQADK